MVKKMVKDDHLKYINQPQPLAGPYIVGNEGPSTFTNWYIGDETFPHSLRVGRASCRPITCQVRMAADLLMKEAWPRVW